MSTAPGGADAPSRRRLVVLALWGIVFFALLIAGLGVTSLLLDADVIVADGGQAPGIVGVCAALAGWAAVLAPALAHRAGVGAAVLAGLAGGTAYVVGAAVASLFAGVDPAGALALAGRLVTHGFAVVVAVAGLLAATGAVVAMRMRPGAARWPWEHPDEDG